MVSMKYCLEKKNGEYFTLICDRKALPGHPHKIGGGKSMFSPVMKYFLSQINLISLNLAQTSDN